MNEKTSCTKTRLRLVFFCRQMANGEAAAPQTNTSALAQWLIDWDLAPLAYQYGTEQKVSADFLAYLQPAYFNALATSTVRLNHLQQLLTLLAEHNVSCVLVKGAAFGLVLYDDPAFRPMGDMDFWIQRSDLAAAWQAASQLNYHPPANWTDWNHIPEHVTQVDFYTPDKSWCLEFHWDLIARPQLRDKLPLAAWWERTQQIEWQGHRVRVLDPAAALMNACVHQMYQHRNEIRPLWLFDVDQMIRGHKAYRLTNEDWQTIQQESQQADILPAVQATLQATQHWFQTPLPEAAQQLLSLAPDAQQQQLFSQITATKASASRQTWQDVKAASMKQRWQIIRGKFFPSPRYMQQRYQIKHWSLLPLYYLWRWLKAIKMVLQGR